MPDYTTRYVFVPDGHTKVMKAFRDVAAAERDAARKSSRSSRQHASHAAKQARAEASARRAAARDIDANASRRERQENRLHARLSREREKAAATEQRRQQRELERAQRQQDRAAKRRESLENRLHAREAKARERRAVAEMKARERVSEGRRRRSGGAIKSLVGGAALGAAALGAYAVGAAARQSIRLDDISTRLAIQGSSGDKRYSGTALRKSFERTAMATPGASAEGVAGAVGAFVTKTGDLEAAQRFQRVFAEISVATGTGLEEIGGAAADLFEKFDIKSVDDMRGAMAALAVQGKNGAFELSDAARQFPKVAAAAQRFGMSGKGGLMTLGGLTQIARRGTGSAEQASTAVEAMFRQLTAKSGVIEKKTGARVWQKGQEGKQARDVRDVLVDTIGGAKGDLRTLQGVFGEEGIRAVSPLISTYNKAAGATQGDEAAKTAAGMRALREELNKAIDATGAEATIKKDLAQAQSTASAQLTHAWAMVQGEIGGRLTPSLTSLGKRVLSLVKKLPVERLADLFGALAEGIEGAIDVFDSIVPGGIRKKKGPAEKRQEARDNIAALGLTPEQQAVLDRTRGGSEADKRKRKSLMRVAGVDQQAIDRYDRATKVIEDNPAFTESGTVHKVVGRDEFVRQAMGLGLTQQDAGFAARDIIADPTEGAQTWQRRAGNYAQGDQLVPLIQQLAETITTARSSTEGVSPGGINRAGEEASSAAYSLGKLTAAAVAAAEKLNSMPSASVAGNAGAPPTAFHG